MNAEDRDILISRVVDGIARDHDWGALEQLAGADPGIWRELAQAQRLHAGLTSAVGQAVAIADDIQIEARDTPVVIARIGGVSRWAGWATAAAVVLVWAAGARLWQPSAGGGGNQAGLMPVSAAEALETYLSKGRDEGVVLGEMPTKVMLEAVPVGHGDGRTDVYYIRQIVERVRVEDLYRSSANEAGALSASPIPIGARPPMTGRGSTY